MKEDGSLQRESGGQEKRFGDSAEEECKEEIDIFSCLCCTGVKLQSAAVLFEFHANPEESEEMGGRRNERGTAERRE